MSAAPPVDEPGMDLTAAEYVLGVLDGPARQTAEARLGEPGFAREVAGWEARLAPMAEAIAPVTPPATIWPAVFRIVSGEAAPAAGPSPAPGPRFASAPSNRVELRLRRSVAMWRGVSAAAAAVAAVLAMAVVWPRPQPSPSPAPSLTPAPAPLMTAELAAKPGARMAFVATVDPMRQQMTIIPAAVTTTRGRTPELWLLPQGGAPIALGLIDFGRPVRMAAAHAVGAEGRTALAVSVEPLGGSPTGQPTGPVIASGTLQAL